MMPYRSKPGGDSNYSRSPANTLQNPQELIELQSVRAMDAIKDACVMKLAHLFERSSDLRMKNWKKNLDIIQNLRKFIKQVKAKGR